MREPSLAGEYYWLSLSIGYYTTFTQKSQTYFSEMVIMSTYEVLSLLIAFGSLIAIIMRK